MSPSRPSESLKYQTRYISYEAREVLEKMQLLIQMRQAVERGQHLVTKFSVAKMKPLRPFLDAETKSLKTSVFTEPTRQESIIRVLKTDERDLGRSFVTNMLLRVRTLSANCLKTEEVLLKSWKKPFPALLCDEHDVKLGEPAVKRLKGISRILRQGFGCGIRSCSKWHRGVVHDFKKARLRVPRRNPLSCSFLQFRSSSRGYSQTYLHSWLTRK